MKKIIVIIALAAAGCTRTKMPDLPTAAVGDTRSDAAQKMAALLAAQDEKIVGLGDEAMRPVAATRSAGRIGELKKARDLKEAYSKALITLHVLEEATLYFDRELRHSSDSFQAGAACFTERSKDYQDDRLRNACLAWAGHFEGLRDRVPYHRDRVAALRAVLPGTLGTMRQSAQLLDDYCLFLANYPADPAPTDDAAPYVDAIRNYARKFEVFERALEIYRRETTPRPAAPRSTGETVSMPPPAGRQREGAMVVPPPPPAVRDKEVAKAVPAMTFIAMSGPKAEPAAIIMPEPTAEPAPIATPEPAPAPRPVRTPGAAPAKPSPPPGMMPVSKPGPPSEPVLAKPNLPVRYTPVFPNPLPPARFAPTVPASVGNYPTGPLRTPAPPPSPSSRPSKPPAKYPHSARGK